MMKVKGGCHCGAVRFEAEVSPVVELLDCNCSKCRKTGYLHLIVPHTHFRLLKGGDVLSEYRFGTGAARHLFCSRCGIKSFYKPRSHPDAWSVNWRALDRTQGLSHSIRPFDGQNWEAAAAILHGETSLPPMVAAGTPVVSGQLSGSPRMWRTASQAKA